MAFSGLPTVIYAAKLRNINSVAGNQGNVPMALPRHKYTFLIDMQINPYALNTLNALTSVSQFITNGKIYGQLKSIDYPKPHFEIETLRTYNRYRKIYKKMHYEPASIVWHDDSTSMVQALVKEYIGFYHQTGNIGTPGNNITTDNGQFNNENGIVGPNVRTFESARPSLGLKMRPIYMRHFFDSITIYDLGTEPTAVNVHTFHKPVMVSFDHDNLDWYSTELISMHWTFEYEGYFFTVGQNVSNYSDVINNILGDGTV
jgi:hypothetical protein